MVNKTIEDGLKPYALGEKLKTFAPPEEYGISGIRKAYRPLGGHAIKTGARQAVPYTPNSVERIALVFGVGLEYFFTDERKRHVVAIARKKKNACGFLTVQEEAASHTTSKAWTLRQPSAS